MSRHFWITFVSEQKKKAKRGLNHPLEPTTPTDLVVFWVCESYWKHYVCGIRMSKCAKNSKQNCSVTLSMSAWQRPVSAVEEINIKIDFFFFSQGWRSGCCRRTLTKVTDFNWIWEKRGANDSSLMKGAWAVKLENSILSSNIWLALPNYFSFSQRCVVFFPSLLIAHQSFALARAPSRSSTCLSGVLRLPPAWVSYECRCSSSLFSFFPLCRSLSAAPSLKTPVSQLH